jgi:two-component sensor histidine kinase
MSFNPHDIYPELPDVPTRVRAIIFPLNDRHGKPQRFVFMHEDITERKLAEDRIQHALSEREVLLREVHHRVKNNLAGIISLISLQIASLSDPSSISLLKDLETRIRSMALVHESLCRTQDLSQVNIASYTENLTKQLFQVYATGADIPCRIDMGEVTMPIETAIPCGLVMSEVITNSLKYAFPTTFSCQDQRNEPCTITIIMNHEGGYYRLYIEDNGIGIPNGAEADPSQSLGLYLIRLIVEHQLRGTLQVSTAGGTAYTIRFPERKSKEGEFQ